MGDKKSGNSSIPAIAVTVGIAAAAAIGGLAYFMFNKDSDQQENNYSHRGAQNNPPRQPAPSLGLQQSPLWNRTANANAIKGRENIETCAICYEDLFTEDESASTPVEIPCEHYFHMACICKWFNKNRSCPICNAPIPNDLKAVYF